MPDEGNPRPITDEVYCFTSRHGAFYHTVALSPLWPAMIGPKPDMVKTQVGHHVFIGATDQPSYLIPYDHKMCSKFAVETETLNLYPKGDAPEGLLQTITVPMKFNLGIMPFYSFKISKDGKLFKREGTDQWILCKIST